MPTSGIAIPNEIPSAAAEFERLADDFAALAEAANTYEDVVRYRDLEQGYRLRAERERLLELSHLYRADNDNRPARL